MRRAGQGAGPHPIYTSMLGMLVATGLSLSSPVGVAVGSALFVLGTRVRVHYEEKLLRHTFGAEFDAYAAAVPAFLPLPWRTPRQTPRPTPG